MSKSPIKTKKEKVYTKPIGLIYKDICKEIKVYVRDINDDVLIIENSNVRLPYEDDPLVSKLYVMLLRNSNPISLDGYIQYDYDDYEITSIDINKVFDSSRAIRVTASEVAGYLQCTYDNCPKNNNAMSYEQYIKKSIVKSRTPDERSLNHFNSLSESFDRKVNNTFSGNDATDWGNIYEHWAIEYYSNKFNCITFKPREVTHPKYPWLSATPDLYAIDENNKLHVIEIKCPFTGWPPNEAPMCYNIQIQIQMEVLNIDKIELLYVKFSDTSINDVYMQSYMEKDHYRFTERYHFFKVEEYTNSNNNDTVDGNNNNTVDGNNNIREKRCKKIMYISDNKVLGSIGSKTMKTIINKDVYNKIGNQIIDSYTTANHKITNIEAVVLKSKLIPLDRDRAWFNSVVHKLYEYHLDVCRVKNVTPLPFCV